MKKTILLLLLCSICLAAAEPPTLSRVLRTYHGDKGWTCPSSAGLDAAGYAALAWSDGTAKPALATLQAQALAIDPQSGNISSARANLEAWPIYIRVNNTADTLIASVAAATAERVWTNSALSIAVAAGDYVEIKAINPTWVTNPLTTIFGGYIYIE